MHIVLIEPEIPGNTGNIARLCAATGFCLHLIRPLGFSVEDKYLKRAGLDYWHLLDIFYHDSFEALWQENMDKPFYFFSTKAPRTYAQAEFTAEDFLVFGKETAGIPEPLLKEHWESCLRIPMMSEARSLNLSNAVAIASYEALRQTGFSNLQATGRQHLN